jgi:opacity protein-like surface antigen
VNFNWITGPEQLDNKTNSRTVLDFVANYTGIKSLILGLNFDYGWEYDEASLVGAGLSDTTASWWGIAAYAAYDWTEKFRTALRMEYFQDTDGARTLALGAGQKVDLWALTATAQYKIWKGLVGRLEYRHDDAGSDKVFKNACCVQPPSGPTRTSQDTITLALYYSFF